MEQPTQIKIDRADADEYERQRVCICESLGAPPEGWDQWTRAVEEGILSGMGIHRAGAAYRGVAVRYKRQASSRVQDGK